MATDPSLLEINPAEASGHGEAGLFTPDVLMLTLTWATFLLLLMVLYKFAWKPILAALDAREESLRRSIDEADRIKEELKKIEETRLKVLSEADQKAKEIIAQSRKAAIEAANTIQKKAKEEAQILLENSRREMKEELKKAQADLRQESAQIAVGLAAKLIEENLTDEKNKKIINDYIKHL